MDFLDTLFWRFPRKAHLGGPESSEMSIIVLKNQHKCPRNRQKLQIQIAFIGTF